MHDFASFDDFPPPTELIQRATDQPDVVLAELFDRAHETYWHLLTFRMDRRLLSRVDAEDVLQEAYLAAAKRIVHWVEQPSCSLFVWGRMTVLQTLVDVHRRHVGADKRSVGREVSIGGSALPNTTAKCLADCLSAGVTSPSGVAVRQESHQQLQTAIEALASTDQEILAMRHFEGLSNKQVAEVLGMTKTAASNRYVRALERLQATLRTVSADESL